jgi:hypothetical protein
VVGISTAAAAAWRAGDYHAVHRELDLSPGDWSPFDVTSGPPPAWCRSWQAASWHRACELRRVLLEVAGKPGRMDRHGRPLGPARLRPRDAVQ